MLYKCCINVAVICSTVLYFNLKHRESSWFLFFGWMTWTRKLSRCERYDQDGRGLGEEMKAQFTTERSCSMNLWNVTFPVAPVDMMRGLTPTLFLDLSSLFQQWIYLSGKKSRPWCLNLSDSKTLSNVLWRRERQMFLHRDCLRVQRVLSHARSLWDIAMAVCPVVSRLTWRTKYLLLLVLCACVIVWITSYADGRVKTPEKVPTTAGKEPQIKMEMDMEQQDEVDEERMPRDLCPEKSPLLRECGWQFYNLFYFRSFPSTSKWHFN